MIQVSSFMPIHLCCHQCHQGIFSLERFNFQQQHFRHHLHHRLCHHAVSIESIRYVSHIWQLMLLVRLIVVSSETNHSMARAPSVPSMVFNNFAQQQQYAAVPPPPPASATAPPTTTTAPPPPPPSQTSFHYEATSLSDYASRATNGSSSALSESAPPTPCSQQYHHHLHMLHPYDGTSSANTSSTALETPSMDSQLLNQYDVDMFTPPSAYYDEQAQHHLTPPQYHQQQQEAKWYNYPIQTQQQPLHYHHQPWWSLFLYPIISPPLFNHLGSGRAHWSDCALYQNRNIFILLFFLSHLVISF